MVTVARSVRPAGSARTRKSWPSFAAPVAVSCAVDWRPVSGGAPDHPARGGSFRFSSRFDPDRSVRLVSFALHWIKAEIHEYILKNWRLVKVATTKAQRKLFFNLRSMKKDLDTLTPEAVTDIAEQLNVREKDVTEMETRMTGHEIALEP